jgi:hypothetical protein
MQTYENCIRRFMETVADNTCTSWVSVFNEQAKVKLDGAEVNDLYAQDANANENDIGLDIYAGHIHRLDL